MLFDLKDGRVIEHEDAFKRWYPASLTKLMTAYVTFRAMEAGELQLDSPIRISEEGREAAAEQDGLQGRLGDDADNALKMMLVKSSNDIAMAIGENVGGSEKAFVERMNAEAARLGMRDTHFVNPNGLHSPEQYTTARDLALLVSALQARFPQYAHYFSIEGMSSARRRSNFNLLVGRYDGADGMKTGFICPSGFNMIGTATRNGRSLVAIVSAKDRRRPGRSRCGHARQGFRQRRTGATTLATLPRRRRHYRSPSTCATSSVRSRSRPTRRSRPEAAATRPSQSKVALSRCPRPCADAGAGRAGQRHGPVPAAMARRCRQ
jgi:D-alanyl-D-alanine carboxypeptidase